ncbi:DEAD/DEAH box helicase [soil metagenome]
MTFTALGLAEPITRALIEERYEAPTPIQAAAIPPALAGRDLVGIAQTGTGKTAAFALPILNRLANAPRQPQPKACRVLVLSPTRELSGQIVESFITYGRHLRVSVTLAIGGVPIGKQIRALSRGVDVLVATPGRLLDLYNSRAVRFDQVEVLVLDEADRMLDMGFIHDIRKVVSLLPKARQTLFFSATMDNETGKLAEQMLNDPVRVAVTPAATTVELIEQRAMRVEKGDKPDVLADILRGAAVSRALVFTRTKHGADRVVRSLDKAGIAAQAIHGNKSQGQRDRVMAAFRAGSITTLVATDIAARGIDVDGITHVINFDLPNIPESYVHRIGRTARAGAKGIAISLFASDEVPFMRDIEKLIRQQIAGSGTDRHSPAPNRGAAPKGNGNRSGNRSAQQQRPQQNQQRRDGKRGQHRRPKAAANRPAHANGIAGVSFLEPVRRGNADGSPAQSG